MHLQNFCQNKPDCDCVAQNGTWKKDQLFKWRLWKTSRVYLSINVDSAFFPLPECDLIVAILGNKIEGFTWQPYLFLRIVLIALLFYVFMMYAAQSLVEERQQ